MSSFSPLHHQRGVGENLGSGFNEGQEERGNHRDFAEGDGAGVTTSKPFPGSSARLWWPSTRPSSRASRRRCLRAEKK